MGKFNFRLVVVVILLFSACKNHNTIGESDNNRNYDKLNLEKNEGLDSSEKKGILFLHFNLYSDNKEKTLILSKAEIKEGTSIKNDYNLLDSPLPDHLLCSFLNSREEIIKTTVLKNPLIQRVEYSDDGEIIKSKVINKDSAYFFLRTNYIGDTYSVKVEMIDSLGMGKELEHFYLETFLEGEKK